MGPCLSHLAQANAKARKSRKGVNNEAVGDGKAVYHVLCMSLNGVVCFSLSLSSAAVLGWDVTRG